MTDDFDPLREVRDRFASAEEVEQILAGIVWPAV